MIARPVKQILLGNALVAFKTFRQTVRVVLHHPFHPHINRKTAYKLKAEQQGAVCNFFPHAVYGKQGFFCVIKIHCLYLCKVDLPAFNIVCKFFNIFGAVTKPYPRKRLSGKRTKRFAARKRMPAGAYFPAVCIA